MREFPWYKRFASDFIAGTLMLQADEKGVYSTLIDMMYDRGETIEDSPRDLARVCGTSTRRFGIILSKLLDIKKLIRTADGRLTNRRFEEAFGGKNRGKIKDNREIKKVKPAKINDLRGHRIKRLERKKESANADSAFAWPQNYRAEFWDAYRLKVGKRAALKALERINGSVEWGAIMDGLARYQEWLGEPGVWRPRQKHAATWINGEHWNDELQHGGQYEQQRTDGSRPRAGDSVLAAARRRAAAIGEHNDRVDHEASSSVRSRVH